jgi:hypothetical protein
VYSLIQVRSSQVKRQVGWRTTAKTEGREVDVDKKSQPASSSYVELSYQKLQSWTQVCNPRRRLEQSNVRSFCLPLWARSHCPLLHSAFRDLFICATVLAMLYSCRIGCLSRDHLRSAPRDPALPRRPSDHQLKSIPSPFPKALFTVDALDRGNQSDESPNIICPRTSEGYAGNKANDRAITQPMDEQSTVEPISAAFVAQPGIPNRFFLPLQSHPRY